MSRKYLKIFKKPHSLNAWRLEEPAAPFWDRQSLATWKHSAMFPNSISEWRRKISPSHGTRQTTGSSQHPGHVWNQSCCLLKRNFWQARVTPCQIHTFNFLLPPGKQADYFWKSLSIYSKWEEKLRPISITKYKALSTFVCWPQKKSLKERIRQTSSGIVQPCFPGRDFNETWASLLEKNHFTTHLKLWPMSSSRFITQSQGMA